MHLHLQIILGHDAECGDIALKRGSAAPHSRGSRDDLVYLLASFLMQLSAPSSLPKGYCYAEIGPSCPYLSTESPSASKEAVLLPK
jgi:hypothetical protein